MQRIVTTIIGCLVLGFAMPSGTAQAASFDQLLQQASKARKAGDLEKTAQLLRKAIAIQPLPPLLNNLGKILEELGDYQGAVDAYKEVTNNPQADANLRSLDAARIATLQGKLGKGWVLIKASAEHSVKVNGRPPAAPPGKEFPVPPGVANLELASLQGGVVTLVSRSFPLGRRTTLSVPVTGPLSGSWGALQWTGASETPTAVEVDGYKIVATAGLQELRLAAGQSALRLTFGKRMIDLSVMVPKGAKANLAGQVDAALAKAKLKTVGTVEEADAMSPWPFVLMGAGVVGAGVGAYFLVSAEDARDTVLNADRDDRGVITSVTLADATEIEEDANADATTGAVLLGVGGALLVGGVVWAVLDGTSEAVDGERSVDVTLGIGSVGLSGRF